MSSVIILSAVVTYLVLRTSLPLTLRYDATDVKVDGPLAITLNQLTHPIATDKVQVAPAVKGRGNTFSLMSPKTQSLCSHQRPTSKHTPPTR
jgi:hypothetical protein